MNQDIKLQSGTNKPLPIGQSHKTHVYILFTRLKLGPAVTQATPLSQILAQPRKGNQLLFAENLLKIGVLIEVKPKSKLSAPKHLPHPWFWSSSKM